MIPLSRFVFIASIMIGAIAFTGLDAPRPTAAQELKKNPTAQDYVERNGGGATIVPAGKLVLDGHRMSCGRWATVLDPNVDDYAKSYPQIVILNMPLIAKVPTAVKLWIYSHECSHLFGGPDENKADCLAVRRGRAAGWLNAEGVDEICNFINVARPDSMHMSGPARCSLMRQCYQDATPKPATKAVE